MVCAVDTRSHAPPEERPDEGKKAVYCAAASAAAGDTEGLAAVCVAGHAAGRLAGSAGEGDDELLSWKLELERVPLLSAREAEVFGLLGEGYSNRSVARELDITERTVKFHVARVLSKLRVESRLQAGLVAHSYRRLYQSAVPCGMDAR
ncbi:helix-turn-helix transcriptional regulator [Streptomyces sp. Qhu-G9]|uniref:helix-turn-helix domain-containing protein n=1 Tax=Streptomyces sp. Qhu-G9 TaxID=3452799 RepID=UPI0022AC8A9A|nr:helix-turn-helix transcriptional regulator [Streptomyces aurantiacus]WAU85156.1 helix-turn-helix transcriptional regulator [Streptomyces aurantiacus]